MTKLKFVKILLKKIGSLLQTPADIILSIVVIPAAYILLTYRKFPARRLKLTTRRLKNIGLFPIRNHYYEPLFVDKLLSFPLNRDRHLPGIDLNIQSQISFLRDLDYSNEIMDLNFDSKPECVENFFFGNGSFESGDAEFLYQFIRKIKPRKVIEIGSGHSTKVARLALLKNMSELHIEYEHICVEPYEKPWLESLTGTKIIRELVEDCKLDWSKELRSGDLLFIDSSHIIRPQGDVLKEYLEIFPELQPGVYVHVHDIFTPRDYLRSWIVDDVKFWNEQYLLEAILSNTTRYEVVAALNFLKNNHYDLFERVCPYVNKEREPGSFYFKVKDR